MQRQSKTRREPNNLESWTLTENEYTLLWLDHPFSRCWTDDSLELKITRESMYVGKTTCIVFHKHRRIKSKANEKKRTIFRAHSKFQTKLLVKILVIPVIDQNEKITQCTSCHWIPRAYSQSASPKKIFHKIFFFFCPFLVRWGTEWNKNGDYLRVKFFSFR